MKQLRGGVVLFIFLAQINFSSAQVPPSSDEGKFENGASRLLVKTRSIFNNLISAISGYGRGEIPPAEVPQLRPSNPLFALRVK